MKFTDMNLDQATSGLEKLGKFNPKKVTKYVLESDKFNVKNDDKQTLGRKEFEDATNFVHNNICSFSDQVFDKLDFDHSGSIDAAEIEFGLSILFA